MAKSRLKGDLNIVFFTHVAQTNAASSVCKLISVSHWYECNTPEHSTKAHNCEETITVSRWFMIC